MQTKGRPKSIYQVTEPKNMKCITILLPEGLSTGKGVTAGHQETCSPGRLETAITRFGNTFDSPVKSTRTERDISQIHDYGLGEHGVHKNVNMERKCPRTKLWKESFNSKRFAIDTMRILHQYHPTSHSLSRHPPGG